MEEEPREVEDGSLEDWTVKDIKEATYVAKETAHVLEAVQFDNKSESVESGVEGEKS